MFSFFTKKFFFTTVYIQVSPDRVTVRNITTGESISERPTVEIRPGQRSQLLAHGDKAGTYVTRIGVQLDNPFGHPRSIVSDFTAGERLIGSLIKRVVKRAYFSTSLLVVMHPLGDPEGGFTQIERRALQEMALGAGASEAHVWIGRALTDHEIVSGSYSVNTDGLVGL